MNKLSEEEIIQRFKILINNFEDDNNYYLYDISQKILDLYKQEKEKNTCLIDNINHSIRSSAIKERLGIEEDISEEKMLDYIDILVSENAELKTLIEHNLKYSHELEKDLFENCSNYVISKDKIKAKIEELKNPESKFYKSLFRKDEHTWSATISRILQELLEEED